MASCHALPTHKKSDAKKAQQPAEPLAAITKLICPIKIELIEIDRENWRYILYKTSDEELICRFSFSPKSFVDTHMLIKLAQEEKRKANESRDYLVQLADIIQNNFQQFLLRSISNDQFTFKNK